MNEDATNQFQLKHWCKSIWYDATADAANDDGNGIDAVAAKIAWWSISIPLRTSKRGPG